QDYPPLLLADGEDFRFPADYFDPSADPEMLRVRRLPSLPGSEADPDWCEHVDRSPLEKREVDLLLVVAPDFDSRLQAEGRPAVCLLWREGDDRSRLVSTRVHAVLAGWNKRLKEVRLLRHGLPADFDEVIEVRDPGRAEPGPKEVGQRLYD